MFDLRNFESCAKTALKIQTKTTGLKPLKLRKIQQKFIDHLKNDFPDGIIRSLSLKPRQAGWSTLIAARNFHQMATRYSSKGILIADKFTRTQAVHSIYQTYLDNLPLPLRPMVAKRNDSEILFDNPNPEARDITPGLSSGMVTETAQDPNAGKSSSRQWAHLSEYAFYPYASEIDQSVQNSIGLHKGTAIFKESTANGMTGDGESFYEQWMAAERGDYLYKTFFVAWYQVDDYAVQVPPGFILNKEEIDLVQRIPEITNANLAWRRMKISEIHTDTSLTPEELFKQDFPSYPEEAFLSSGRPVFNQDKLKLHINKLRESPPTIIKPLITQKYLSMYPQYLKVFEAATPGKKFLIGADVAEGLATGDYSSACILDDDFKQVATFHGHLPPDIFGKILVELAKIYNKALIIPEQNNMGHTTLQAIKDMDYLNIYQREVKDEIDQSKITKKLGWVTTASSKQKMMNTFIARYRDGEVVIREIELLREMMRLSREDNGEVELNGRDRVVAICLALAGVGQLTESAVIYDPNKTERLHWETKDLSREAIKKKGGKND